MLLSGLILSTVVITASLGLWNSLLSSGVTLVSGKHLYGNSAGQQFYWLLPLLSCLLVGAGILLLVLLLMLLAAERRAELGMSRALGLQRSHLTQLLLFEGAGYGLVAVVVGVPLGLLLTRLELGLILLVHPVWTSRGRVLHVSLPLRLDWPSLVIPGCLSLLVILLTVWLTAHRISRLSIVTAMRDLDASPSRRPSLLHLLPALWHPPLDRAGQPIPETRTGRRARRAGAALGLLWGIWMRGLLALLAGGTLFVLATATGQHWLVQLAVALLLAGLGLLVGWLLPLSPLPRVTPALARRLGFSLIGLGWLISGLQLGGTFLTLFLPIEINLRVPSALELLLDLLLPVLGAVVLVLTNADALVALFTLLLRHLRGFAPLSRTSLAYPLTFRFRTAWR